MVRKKVRTQFLLFENPNKQKQTNKQTIKQTNKHGKEKDKNSIITFEKKNRMVRKKIRTRFSFFKKSQE